MTAKLFVLGTCIYAAVVMWNVAQIGLTVLVYAMRMARL